MDSLAHAKSAIAEINSLTAIQRFAGREQRKDSDHWDQPMTKAIDLGKS